MLSRVTYDNVYYTHQGWLTVDQSHLFLDDELDESNGPDANTRTLIWDVSSLRDPQLVDSFFSTEESIDHNQYVNGTHIYQANYCAGLRVLEIDQSGTTVGLTETGFFKVALARRIATVAATCSLLRSGDGTSHRLTA